MTDELRAELLDDYMGVPFTKKEQKRAEAQKRQAAYDKLTTHQKLVKLTKHGHGHCKQAQKLAARIIEETK